MAQVAHRARKQRVAPNRLDRYDEPLSPRVPARRAEPLADREPERDRVVRRECREPVRRLVDEHLGGEVCVGGRSGHLSWGEHASQLCACGGGDDGRYGGQRSCATG